MAEGRHQWAVGGRLDAAVKGSQDCGAFRRRPQREMDSENRGGTENRQAHRGRRGRASFLRTAQRDRAIATARLRDRAIVAVALGSARVSRAGERVLAIANFSSNTSMLTPARIQREDRFGATPKPTRETRALPGFAVTLQRNCICKV